MVAQTSTGVESKYRHMKSILDVGRQQARTRSRAASPSRGSLRMRLILRPLLSSCPCTPPRLFTRSLAQSIYSNAQFRTQCSAMSGSSPHSSASSSAGSVSGFPEEDLRDGGRDNPGYSVMTRLRASRGTVMTRYGQAEEL